MEVNVQKQCVKVFTTEGVINMQPLVVLTQDLTGVAQQDTLVQGISDIRGDISNIDIDTSTLAKEQTLTDGIGAIRDDISHISIDTSTLAQRTDVKDGNDTAISAIKEVRSEVGTSSDTASETGTTIFAVVKWVKDKVKSIFNLIGSPASGQPSTLFAAIAAGGSGGGDAQESTSQEILGKVQGIIDSHIITSQSLDGLYTFRDGTIVNPTPGALLGNYKDLTYINDPYLVDTSSSSFPNGLQYLKAMILPNVRIIPSLYNDITLEVGIFTNATSWAGYMSAPACREIDILNMSASAAGQNNGPNFSPMINLIKLTAGKNFVSGDRTIILWNPTNALNSGSSSLVEPGESFANNLEKLLYNIRTYIVANLPTMSSPTTILLNENVKAAINGDQTTADAFAAKNWTIA